MWFVDSLKSNSSENVSEQTSQQALPLLFSSKYEPLPTCRLVFLVNNVHPGSIVSKILYFMGSIYEAGRGSRGSYWAELFPLASSLATIQSRRLVSCDLILLGTSIDNASKYTLSEDRNSACQTLNPAQNCQGKAMWSLAI